MPISDHIGCPRCSASIGEECVQRDPDDPSDAGQHSDRIYAFMEHGSLEARTAVHVETEEALKARGWEDDLDDGSLFLSYAEVTAYNERVRSS